MVTAQPTTVSWPECSVTWPRPGPLFGMKGDTLWASGRIFSLMLAFLTVACAKSSITDAGPTVGNGPIIAISNGGAHTCALRTSGKVLCWGYNGSRQLGDGVETHSTCTPPPSTGSTASVDCALSPVTVSGLVDAVEISAGGSSTCARRASGAVVCWGGNDHGQLGDGTTVGRPTPVTVLGLDDAIEISVGNYHACAVRSSGSVMCWGDNQYGQIGDGITSHSTCGGRECSTAPVAVTAVSEATGVSVGDWVSCARQAAGTVMCWGINGAEGLLGDGRTHSGCGIMGTIDCSFTPVVVFNLADAAEIAVGGNHACARRSSGEVACWGRNLAGELGDGSLADHATPVAVDRLSDAVEVAAGSEHTCARRLDGSVVCWGRTEYGALGSGPAGLDCHAVRCYPSPWLVIGIVAAVELSANGRNTCARQTTGEMLCWGANDLGQVGDGTTVTRFTPVRVLGL